jgi:PAS domain S-box-containing protein
MTTDHPRVLVIEDDPVYAAFARASLRKSDDPPEQILFATTLADALRQLAQEPRTDLILLDLGLPDSDGLDTLVAVRDRAPETAIIVMTGRDDRVLARRAVQEGAQDYFVKGSGSEKHLTRAVGYAIERKQGERTLRRIAKQQSAVAGLGQRALATTDMTALLQDAAEVVSSTLDCSCGEIYEWSDGSALLVLRATVGWAAAVDGTTSVDVGGATDIGLALRQNRSVVFEAAVDAQGFQAPPWLAGAGIVSGACVVIHGDDRPYGVLAVHHGAARTFSGEDVQFLELVAHVMGSAISRQEAEKALRESEARYRRIVETANEGVWMTNADWRIEYVNRIMAAMMGYRAEEMVGRSMLDFVFDDDRERVMDGIDPRRAGPREPVDLRFRRKGGAEIWVTASTAQIQGERGQVEGLLAMCTDITARRRAAAERARLNSAVEQAAEAIMMTKRDGTIVYVNPAWQRLTGYSSTDALGRTPRLLKADVQDPRVYADLWATILDGRVWRGEITNRSESGALYTWDETITPVRDEAGRITEFIAFGQDTSARRDLEARLRQSQKMEAVGRLAGGVAHDFNNLLTVISGYSERLLAGLAENDPLRKGADAIKRAADRAAALTHQLLAFSRRQIMAPKVLDLNAVVANMNKLLRRLIGEDVELVTQAGADLGRIKADPNQVEQVIMNLAVNSRDAMPQGGTLTIETSNVVIDMAFAAYHLGLRPGAYVQLAVTDTGCGMDQETQSHLYEPFFTTKGHGKGTGLGLSTTYGIVKQSGGYIWVDSEVGRGSTFRIYLPRIEEASDALVTAPAARSAPRGSETILLVEDEDAVRHLLRDVLRRYGYTVLEAGNGPAAIEICKAHDGPIHLVVTDMVMPYMSGWEVADAVSALRPKARIIYMSGYIEQIVVEQRVLEAGVAFLGKPFTPETLGRKVREVLDGEHGRAPASIQP